MNKDEIIALWNKGGPENMKEAIREAIELAESESGIKVIFSLIQGDFNRYKLDNLSGILSYEEQRKTLAQLSQRFLGTLDELIQTSNPSNKLQKQENQNQGNTIIQQANKIYNIRHINEANFEAPLSKEINIPITDFGFEKPIPYLNRTITSNEDSIEEDLIDAIKKNNKIVLLGSAGLGKTQELMRIVFELRKKREFQVYGYSLDNLDIDIVLNSIFTDLNKLSEDVLSKIFFIFDGFDVASDRKIARRTILNLPKGLNVIVSCRTNFYVSGILNKFKTYHLTPLKDNVIQAYIIEELPNDISIFKNVSKEYNFEELLSIPFYLIKLVQDYKRTKSLPKSKSDFFNTLINDAIDRDIYRYNITDIDSSNRKDKLRLCLKKLAFYLQCLDKTSINDEELSKIIDGELEELIKKSSLIEKTVNEGKEHYKFIHKNFQEYLTAKIISELEYDRLIKLITFKPEHLRIKDSFTNCISFLFQLLDKKSPNFDKLTDFITTNQTEAFWLLETHNLDESIRLKILKIIFNKFNNDGRLLNWKKFDLTNLSKFSQFMEGLNFIIQTIGKKEYNNNMFNALWILSGFEKDFVLENENNLKPLLEDIIFSKKLKDNFEGEALDCYFKFVRLKDEDIQKAFNIFGYSENTWARFKTFHFIHISNKQDVFIKHLLELYENNILIGRKGKLWNEDFDLETCIKNVKTVDSIIQVLGFFKNKIDYRNSEEIIDTIVTTIIEKYPTNRLIYDKIKESLNLESPYSISKSFIKYFFETNQNNKLCREILDDCTNELEQRNAIHLVSIFFDQSCIDYLSDKFIQGSISRNIVEEFQHIIGRRKPELMKEFNIKINQKETISLPKYPDFEKDRIDKLNSEKLIIFDQNLFIEEVEKFFLKAGKNELTYDEYWEMRKQDYTDEVFSHTIIYFLRIGDREKLNKLDTIDFIHQHYSNIIFPNTLIDFIQRNNLGIEFFTEEDKNKIYDWCDNTFSKVTLNIEVIGEEIHYSYIDDWFVFFIIYFSIYKYPEEFYLNLLSFIQFDKIKLYYDFVIENPNLKKKQINDRIIKNIENKIKIRSVLNSHLDILDKENLMEAKDFIPQYFDSKDSYTLSKIIDTYVKLGGDLYELEPLIHFNKDSIRNKIINLHFEHDNRKIEHILLDLFESENDENAKLSIAGFLVRLQILKGFDFILNSKKFTLGRTFPDISLAKWEDIIGLPSLFKYYEIIIKMRLDGEKEDIQNDHYQMFITILYNIALSKNQFLKFKKAGFLFLRELKFRNAFTKILPKWLFSKRADKKSITDLMFHLENLEKQYYINKEVDMSLQEVSDIYKLYFEGL